MKLPCHNAPLTDPFETVKTVPIHVHPSQGLQKSLNKIGVHVRHQGIQWLSPLLLQVQALRRELQARACCMQLTLSCGPVQLLVQHKRCTLQ